MTEFLCCHVPCARRDPARRALSALVHGTGKETCAALRLKRSGIDKLTKTVRAHGTKTHAPNRTANVSEWAWPISSGIRDADARCLRFPGIDRWRASDVHRAACKELGEGFEDYRLPDARRTNAVRAIRAGAASRTSRVNASALP